MKHDRVYISNIPLGADGYYIPDNTVLIVKSQEDVTDKYWVDLVKPEPLENVYVYTKEELHKLLMDTYISGRRDHLDGIWGNDAFEETFNKIK